jgi:hypothetical protein
MVLNLSWSCSRGRHKSGVHAEVSGTGAESRRERGSHPPGDDAPRAQPAARRSQHVTSQNFNPRFGTLIPYPLFISP